MKKTNGMELEPIKFEVIRNALVETTEEMAISLRRSAYSTNIKTRSDFSCAFFDSNLRVIAQASGQPVHLGSLAVSVPTVINNYGPENLSPGDAILANDPYLGGVHLNDITLISPVYFGDQLFGYVASLAHHVDVGGAPASIGAFQEVFQEGIIIPGVKLLENGKINDDVFRLVLSQIRSKEETAGDFRAQVAANNTGIRRLQLLIDRYGPEEISFYMGQLLSYTRRRALAEIKRLPKGEHKAEGVVDYDGYTDEPVRLVATILVADEEIVFDMTGSDTQRRAPVNSTYAQTFAACAYVLKCLIDPDVPVNAGFYETVKMIAPEGTVTNCSPPAPVVGGWETQTRLIDVILKALSPAIPDSVPAGTKATMFQVGFGGTDPRSGKLYAFYEAIAGGYGGRATLDGPDAVQAHGQNTENAPIEEIEINYPVRITRYELIEETEGAGRHRGGLGLRRDYLFPDHSTSFTILADRDRWGPWGLFDGESGSKANFILNPERDNKVLRSKVTLQLEPGDVISFQTCGGGGYGAPSDRNPQAVLTDVRDGKIGITRAREVYRVLIDPKTGRVDDKKTAELRAQS